MKLFFNPSAVFLFCWLSSPLTFGVEFFDLSFGAHFLTLNTLHYKTGLLHAIHPSLTVKELSSESGKSTTVSLSSSQPSQPSANSPGHTPEPSPESVPLNDVRDIPPPSDDPEDQEEEDENYFLSPLELSELLEALTELAERNKLILVFAFDIDGTMIVKPEPHMNSGLFLYQQERNLRLINEWLHEGSGKEMSILIQNTARHYRNSQTIEASQSHEGLPDYHFIIHRNGAQITASTEHTLPLMRGGGQIGSYAETLSTQLESRFDHNNIQARSALSNMDIRQFDIDVPAATAEGSLITADTRLSLSPSSFFYRLERCYKKMSRFQPSHKFTYEPRPPVTFLYHFDRSVNKGSALVMLMVSLLSFYPDKKLLLITAGDFLDDATALRPDLLSQAFVQKSERTSAAVRADLQSLVDPGSHQAVLDSWFLSIAPSLVHSFLAALILNHDLYDSPKLQTATLRGMEGLLSRTLQQLRMSYPEASPQEH